MRGSLRWVDRLHRLRRWLVPAALLALLPKCVLCALAYAGLGAALGFGGRELCGGPAAQGLPWGSLLAGAGGALAAARLAARRGTARRVAPARRNLFPGFRS